MDERSEPRTTTDLLVPAIVNGRSISLQIYNLSPLGCMLESAHEAIEVDTTIVIGLISGISARGLIIWRQESFAGVEFAYRLHPAVVQHLGFNFSMDGIEPWHPQDRFGRMLPPLNVVDFRKFH